MVSSRRHAEQLVSAASARERRRVLARVAPGDRIRVAHALKDYCYEVWSSEPTKARLTASALADLARLAPEAEIDALAAWTAGIASLTRGKLDETVVNLDRAAAIFRKLRKEHDAASTQVAKIVVLALLGRYEDALATGRAALRVFEKYGDELSAGKVEKNLGNIVARRDGLRKAEKYYLSALRRFEKTGDVRELTMCETNLADHFAELNDFVAAEKYYELALRHARAANLDYVEAETEATIGNLAMQRGRYADALRLLETARSKFERLRVAHRSLVADLDIAAIYQTLNLTDEAIAVLAPAASKLRRLGLAAEEAQARASLGRAALAGRDFGRASRELRRSEELYETVKDPAGIAEARLAMAELEMARGRYGPALAELRRAARPLARSGSLRRRLFADWLRGEALAKSRRFGAATVVFKAVSAAATDAGQPELARAALNSLGETALARGGRGGRRAEAKSFFERAVKLAERLRAPLASEEFRMAFLADKLAPYENLAKIHLADGDARRAFEYVEQARARTLFEALGASGDAADGLASPEIAALREELNWFYSRLARAAGVDESAALEREAVRREKKIAELMRRRESTRGAASRSNAADALPAVCAALGPGRALVEFAVFDGEFAAFVVTDEGVAAVASLAREDEIVAELEALRFQFGALRYGASNLGPFMAALKLRADAHLERLHAMLIAPLGAHVGGRDLVVVPAASAHYVPFPALRRGGKYLIEERGVVCAPSASVWAALDGRPARRLESALLVGYADEKIPLVEREIEAIGRIFPDAAQLTGEAATFAAYRREAPSRDLLHLACHGSFRPENPLFSSLHLADGTITVRDVCAQRLTAALVTLSACETGLNKLYAGDEILGLARGFLAAGAETLVLSLWTVSDEATAALMTSFYAAIAAGATPAAALRTAQLAFVSRDAHPYFWAPFAVIGK